MTTDVLRFDTGEVELAYRAWPGDSPPVLLMHGGTASRSIWDDRLSFCGKQAIFAYDARGHGDSGRTHGVYTVEHMAKDAEHFLEHVVGGPAIVVGHSMGGAATLLAAAHTQDLFVAIATIDVPLKHVDPPFDPAVMRASAGRPYEELIREGLPVGRARDISRLDPGMLDGIVSGGSFWANWNPEEILRRIECPLLFEHGELSQGSLVHGDDLELVSRVSDVTTVQITGSGHAPQVSQTERFMEVFSEFVERVVKSMRNKA